MILPFGDESIERAAEILRQGGLVAFPTETVYGLGARADSSAAVRGIYAAKGRPAENPSIVHVATAERAFELAEDPTGAGHALATRFWPGPLTLVLSARPGVIASEVMAGGTTVALRVPNHPAALALLAAVDLPIAAPSANRSNSISPTTALHVERSLGDRVALIVDAGATGFGIESTIVDLASSPPRLLRRGSISYQTLVRVLPELVDGADLVTAERERAPSPGTYARHYAPSVPLVTGPREAIARQARAEIERGARVGVLAIGTARGLDFASVVEVLEADPEAYARGLYAALHALDAASCERLYAEAPPKEQAWAAVWDRLARASTAM